MTKGFSSLPKLSGYDIDELLYDGAKSLVYRGVRQSDQQPVVLKLLKQILPTYNELLKFRHQYHLLSDIQIEGIVSPLALETWQEKTALILPDNGSIDLQQFMQQKESAILSVDEFLAIAQQLARILEQLHQHNITHKDIKPANIIIQPDTGQVALIDFSIASQLNNEKQSLQSPDALSGTLSYLSPEQTGRMNRCIDYRSDFYSLGVTFYELLTTQLPFYSADAMELVHSHLAREPESLIQRRSDIPRVVNDIVLKLMAKNAEDRYQSGAGLLADLQRCQQSWQDCGKISDFTLGQTDAAQGFHLSEKLYGRLDEVKTLFNTFERVCHGNMEAVLISGLSGIGKTALVNEIHKPMTGHRGYFIKGKFDPLKRDTPFSALTQALRDLIKQLLAESDTQKQIWQAQLQLALGQQGQLLIELIPELEQLIGRQPDIEDLQGAAASHRFHHVIQQFIQVFSTEAHPLVLFLDDLQWIDSATLQLLTVLLDCQPAPQWHRANQSLMFIGAYRHNETPSEHPLYHTLDKLAQNGLPMQSLTLNPLKETDLNMLFMDACRCQNDYAWPLTQIMYEKTQGNPFFVHQFLQQVSDEGLLTYDFSQEHWIYDLQAIEELAASADVLDFMAVRLQRLAPEVLNTLKLAACLGYQFDLLTLSAMAQITPAQCAQHCWQAVQEKLLLAPNDNYYLAVSSAMAGDKTQAIESLQCRYRFAHDRIQQAAYSLFSAAQKAQIHLETGRFLKQQLKQPLKQQQKQTDSHDALFNAVNQLNAGKHLISDPQERIELAELNYRAGQIARRATAYAAARQYSHNGLDLLIRNQSFQASWQNNYNLTLNLHEEAIEAAFLLGDYSAQQQLTDDLLAHSNNILDSIRTRQLYCLSLIAQGDYLAAVNYALPVLKQLGIEFPDAPGAEDFQTELAKTQALIAERDIASLIDLPLMTEPNILAGVRLLEKLDAALYVARPALFPLAVFKRIQLALRYGNAPEIVPFYGAYGFILSGVVNDIDSGYEFGLLALALLDKLPAQAQKPLTYVNVYGSQPYKNAVRDSIKPLQQASYAGLETGDLQYAAAALLWANIFSFFSGVDLSQLQHNISRDLKLMAGIHQDAIQVYTRMLHQLVLNLAGENDAAILLQGEAYQIDISLPQHQQANDGFALCAAQLYQAMLAYWFYDYDRASSALDMAKGYQDAIIGSLFSPELVFYDALIQLALYQDSNSAEDEQQAKELLAQLNEHQATLSHLAHHAPMNFAHKWALVEAERCRLSGDFLAAADHYDSAIDGAQQHKFIHEEALACELAACFYLQRKKILIAQAYMTKAYYAWARWGSKAKTEQLEKQYPQLLNQLSQSQTEPDASIHASSTNTSLKNETSVSMDLDTVMKFAQSLSSELSLSGVLEKLLSAVMENAGAQRVVLLLKTPGDASEGDSSVADSSEGNSSEVLAHWHIAGECRMAKHSRQIQPNVPLQDYQALPKTLLQQVIKTSQAVVLDDARESYQAFYEDPYFTHVRAQQSILCQPVLSKGKLTGLLYLENKLTTHVFQQSRQQLIQMMAAQAAISLENAQLYENLEDKVKERTRELKQAQAQLIKHARASGQAEIAIDVMHNIGNILTSLKTSTESTYSALRNSQLVEQTPRLMQRLADTLEKDQTLDATEQHKLLQVTQRLPDIIARDYSSHADNLQRACEAIHHIENFIHLQSKYTGVKPMNDYLNINELLNDALKMLDNVLHSEHIEVTLQQDDLADWYGEEYQLMQILLSVIRNACEAMSAVAIEQRQLTISSRIEKAAQSSAQVDSIVITIQDRGIGFAPELQERIFASDYISVKKQQRRNEPASNSSFNLHACANYLIAHGGGIRAQSDGAGKGAVFTIKLSVKAE